MSWREDLKNKAQQFYHRAEKLCHQAGIRAGGWFGALVMMVSTNAAAGDKPNAPTDNRQPDKIETTNFINSVAVDAAGKPNIYDYNANCDIKRLDLDKVAAAISKLTLADVLAKGLVNKEDIQSYQFAAEDFQQMKSGNLGLRLERKFAANCAGKTPQGDCLTGVRETVCAVTGQNIYTHSGAAREWWERVDEREESPFVIIGKVQVRDEGGRLQDRGNIKLNDLKALNDGIVVIDGNKKGQPAGHVSFVKARYDTKGNFIGTDSYCDGKENYVNVVDHKIGGGSRRYGNTAVVLLPKDTKPSAGLVDYIVNIVADRENNALEVGKKLAGGALKLSAKDFVKSDTFAITADAFAWEQNNNLSATTRIKKAKNELHENGRAPVHRALNNDKTYPNFSAIATRVKNQNSING